jgi:hypothetical protein
MSGKLVSVTLDYHLVARIAHLAPVDLGHSFDVITKLNIVVITMIHGPIGPSLESYRLLPISSGTPIRDAWPYTRRRSSVFALSSSSHTHIPGHHPPSCSLPFLWCSHLIGVPRDRWMAILSLTLDQCRLGALFLLP